MCDSDEFLLQSPFLFSNEFPFRLFSRPPTYYHMFYRILMFFKKKKEIGRSIATITNEIQDPNYGNRADMLILWRLAGCMRRRGMESIKCYRNQHLGQAPMIDNISIDRSWAEYNDPSKISYIIFANLFSPPFPFPSFLASHFFKQRNDACRSRIHQTSKVFAESIFMHTIFI